jgi:hypothetical protein
MYSVEELNLAEHWVIRWLRNSLCVHYNSYVIMKLFVSSFCKLYLFAGSSWVSWVISLHVPGSWMASWMLPFISIFRLRDIYIPWWFWRFLWMCLLVVKVGSSVCHFALWLWIFLGIGSLCCLACWMEMVLEFFSLLWVLPLVRPWRRFARHHFRDYTADGEVVDRFFPLPSY